MPIPDEPAADLPDFGLHTADGLPDGVQNLTGGLGADDATGLVDDFDAMAGIDTPASATGAETVMTAPAPADAVATDVLGETQVAEAVAEAPVMADATVVPVYDQPPPLDDLGLETPILVDEFTPDGDRSRRRSRSRSRSPSRRRRTSPSPNPISSRRSPTTVPPTTSASR